MSTILALVFILIAFLLLRRLAEERIACNSCFVVASKRRMTTLADGRLICKACLKRVMSSTLQRATAKLAGAEEEGTFALEPGDGRIGDRCALCSQKLQPLDSVCARGERLTHLVCAQLARRLSHRASDQKLLNGN
jgi:hypothetical protein